MNGVVPITAERFCRKENALQFIVRHLDAGRILARVQLGLDREPGACADGADELDYSLAISEGTAPPVLGDVAEETVLDLVPLRRAGRDVRHADAEPGAVGEALQFGFPETRACPLLPPASAVMSNSVASG